jgi:hypothetical protein
LHTLWLCGTRFEHIRETTMPKTSSDDKIVMVNKKSKL